MAEPSTAATNRNTNHDKKTAATGRRSRWTVPLPNLPKLPRMGSRSRSQERSENTPEPGTGARRTRDLRNRISFWKRKSASITDYDPQYRVTYLGNVLTGWAKGNGCVDKPLSTLWRNHISSDKPDIVMKMTVVGSGLRAVTKEHGLTEYWANRITYCTAHPSYPRVFCWIYRHEGRKMKQELRCHAVLCPKEDKAKQISGHLTDRLHQALIDFKKEKISRQNARLSLANSIHENPTMPYRKLLLQTGTCNYKPPIERSKSAPKLTSIEEADMEEEFVDSEDDDEECILNTNYNIAMLHVHHNPAIILDNRSESTLALQVTGRYSDPVFREEDEVIRFQEENSDDEEDEITDYIGSVEVHSVTASGVSDSPASQGRGTLSCSPRELRLEGAPGEEDCHSLSSDQSDSGHGEDAETITESLGLIRISEQDTISDESGYSEEPGAMREVNVVRVNITSETPASRDEFTVEEVFTPGPLMGSPHKLEIQCNDPCNNNNTQSGDQKMTSHRNSWCQPINIEIDSVTDSVSQYDSQESSPRDTSSADASPPLPSLHTHPAQMPPLSLSSPRDTEDRPLSPNVILAPSTPREGTLPSPRATDLSVKSVFLTEFTAAEKLKYIDRSNIKNTKNTMVLNRQEFCINI